MKKIILLLCIIMVFAFQVKSQLSNGVIAYWKLDAATVTNAATGTYNGTIIGATSGQTGKINTAYSFDGGDGINFGNQSVFNVGTTADFSLSIWIKTSSPIEQMVISKYNTGVSPGYVLGTEAGKAYACIRDGLGSGTAELVVVNGTSNVNNNAWHLLVATFDRNGDLRLYVDGIQEAYANISTITDPVNNTSDFCIGYRNYAISPFYFTGSIDEAGVWNRTLAAAEVTQLYNSGNGLAYPFTLYNYSASASPSEGGTVSMSPAGGSYPAGTNVTLTASPNSGYTFIGWNGSIMTNPYTITVTANSGIAAVFVPNGSTYTLSTSSSPTAGGTIALSPSGGNYGSGSVVTATATANSGYTFTSWSGALTGTTNPGTITMNASKTLVANFTAVPSYSLTITTPTNGTITASPAGPNYASGTTVTLTANPAAGYQLSAWTGATSGTTNPTTLIMNGNKTVSATFTPTTTFSLTITTPTNGTITVSPAGPNYASGTTVTLTANPASGYQLSAWTVP